jgi:hypothetical protein
MITSGGTSLRPLWKLAGAALLVAGLSYITLAVILGIVSRGHLPASGQELLDYVVAHGSLVQAAMVVFIIKDTCILIAFPILAMALGGMRHPSLWVATVVASMGMLLDILSGLIVIAFREFAGSYTAADPSERQSYVIVAEFVFRYVWRVETLVIVGLLSGAVVLFSRLMRDGQFGRVVPWVGIVLGVVGVAGAVAGFIQPVLFLSVWYIAVGLKLLCGEPF